jgi:hypothetical protein
MQGVWVIGGAPPPARPQAAAARRRRASRLAPLGMLAAAGLFHGPPRQGVRAPLSPASAARPAPARGLCAEGPPCSAGGSGVAGGCSSSQRCAPPRPRAGLPNSPGPAGPQPPPFTSAAGGLRAPAPRPCSPPPPSQRLRSWGTNKRRRFQPNVPVPSPFDCSPDAPQQRFRLVRPPRVPAGFPALALPQETGQATVTSGLVGPAAT